MKRIPILILLAMVAIHPALAGVKRITVHVNGMVCDLCSQGVTKKFNSQEAIEKTEVDLTNKQVRLFLKDGKDFPDNMIDELIRDSGFNIEKIER